MRGTRTHRKRAKLISHETTLELITLWPLAGPSTHP
jgi:hypothetical protein